MGIQYPSVHHGWLRWQLGYLRKDGQETERARVGYDGVYGQECNEHNPEISQGIQQHLQEANFQA